MLANSTHSECICVCGHCRLFVCVLFAHYYYQGSLHSLTLIDSLSVSPVKSLVLRRRMFRICFTVMFNKDGVTLVV